MACTPAHVRLSSHRVAALPHLRRALEILIAHHGENAAEALDCNDMLARALAATGDNAAAVTALRRSLEIKKLVHGDSSQEVADCHNDLAIALQEIGEGALAEHEARAALSLHIELFGETHAYAPLRYRTSLAPPTPAHLGVSVRGMTRHVYHRNAQVHWHVHFEFGDASAGAGQAASSGDAPTSLPPHLRGRTRSDA